MVSTKHNLLHKVFSFKARRISHFWCYHSFNVQLCCTQTYPLHCQARVHLILSTDVKIWANKLILILNIPNNCVVNCEACWEQTWRCTDCQRHYSPTKPSSVSCPLMLPTSGKLPKLYPQWHFRSRQSFHSTDHCWRAGEAVVHSLPP